MWIGLPIFLQSSSKSTPHSQLALGRDRLGEVQRRELGETQWTPHPKTLWLAVDFHRNSIQIFSDKERYMRYQDELQVHFGKTWGYWASMRLQTLFRTVSGMMSRTWRIRDEWYEWCEVTRLNEVRCCPRAHTRVCINRCQVHRLFLNSICTNLPHATKFVYRYRSVSFEACFHLDNGLHLWSIRLYHNALQCHFEAQGDRRNRQGEVPRECKSAFKNTL